MRLTLPVSIVNSLPKLVEATYGRYMKLINYGETDWLVGDDAAGVLFEYSILMAKGSSADSVDVAVLNSEGRVESVSFLIGPATMMTSRDVESDFEEPENEPVITEVRQRMQRIISPPPVLPSEPGVLIDDYEI